MKELCRVQRRGTYCCYYLEIGFICFSVWGPRSVKCLECIFLTGLNSNFCFHRQFHRPLDTVSGLLNLSLLYHVWLCGVFLLMTWYISWILFKIYATEVSIEFFVNAYRSWSAQSYFSKSTLCPTPFWEVGFWSYFWDFIRDVSFTTIIYLYFFFWGTGLVFLMFGN